MGLHYPESPSDEIHFEVPLKPSQEDLLILLDKANYGVPAGPGTDSVLTQDSVQTQSNYI